VKAATRDSLEGYIRHAEHYGTDEVFETALDEGLGLRDVAQLAIKLQYIDPRWKLTLENQYLLVLALLGAGMNLKDAARAAGVTLPTARLWAGEQEDTNEAPDLALRRASKARFVDLKGIVRGWKRTS
jgi:hypothetical protein